MPTLSMLKKQIFLFLYIRTCQLHRQTLCILFGLLLRVNWHQVNLLRKSSLNKLLYTFYLMSAEGSKLGREKRGKTLYKYITSIDSPAPVINNQNPPK